MNIKYNYDKKTEENLKRFKFYLSQYEELLRKKLADDGFIGDDFSRAFLSDNGRMSIENQIIKIKELAIPESIEFTGV